MRLTSKVFLDLAIWMGVLGVAVGALLPLLAVALGVSSETAWSSRFVAACLAAGAVVGALNVAVARMVVGRRLRRFTAEMQRVSESVDPAVEAGTAYETFTAALARRGDIDELAAEALQHYARYAGAAAGMVLYESAGELVVASSHGFVDASTLAASDRVVAVARSGVGQVLESPDDVLVEGVEAALRPRMVLIDPIIDKGVQLGVIVLASGAGFDVAERSRIVLFGRGLALALHVTLAHDRLERLAAIDPLTGVLNRRFGLDRLREEFGRAVRGSSALGVLMLDVDHFRSVNDAHGHLVGDRVLRTVALITRAALRGGDVVVRLGDEAFLVVLPAAGFSDAGQIAERIRALVANASLVDGASTVRVTVSVGGAAYPDSDVETEEALVRLADEALARAKSDGRNRVEIAR